MATDFGEGEWRKMPLNLNKDRLFFGIKRAAILALIIAMQGSASTAKDRGKMCPLDRTIFRDKNSGREFIALKVGLNQEYSCGQKSSYHHPEKQLQEKCGPPLGDEVIVGRMSGAPVVAVFTVIRGLPCCSWRSYRGAPTLLDIKEWLRPDEMPLVELGSQAEAISEDPDRPDNGPLGGGDFVPVECRPSQ